jgi:hypothetical protein
MPECDRMHQRAEISQSMTIGLATTLKHQVRIKDVFRKQRTRETVSLSIGMSLYAYIRLKINDLDISNSCHISKEIRLLLCMHGSPVFFSRKFLLAWESGSRFQKIDVFSARRPHEAYRRRHHHTRCMKDNWQI